LEYSDIGFGWFLLTLIQTVIFLIPVLVLAYNQGKKDQKFTEMKRDLDGLGEKVAKIRDDQTSALKEMATQVVNIDKMLTKVTAQIDNLTDAIREMKR